MKASLTTNEKIVLSYLIGYIDASGAYPENRAISRALSLPFDKVQQIQMQLIDKDRLAIKENIFHVKHRKPCLIEGNYEADLKNRRKLFSFK